MAKNQLHFLSRWIGKTKMKFSIKRSIVLSMVALVGYYCMFYASGAALNGQALTGAPFNGSNTCASCHGGANFGATIVIELLNNGTPVTSYVAGQSYTVRITRTANTTFNNIANAGFGFQMTCATGASNVNYNGWGTSLPANTANRSLSSRNYIEQTSKISKTITQLSFPWTAPSSASVGDVKFFAALNSVNGDGNDGSGDHVTSTSLTITAPSCPTPSVSIAASSTTICSGSNVTFTATPTNGGTTPTYQWKNNNVNISGATNATYSTTTLANGNQITCTMTPAAPCNTSSATSNTITMTINPNLTPSIGITASTNNICAGTSVTFTSSLTNGGTSPSYQWKKNGSNIVGATSSSLTTVSLANGDIISATITTAGTCFTATTASSNTITMVVNPTQTPSVVISATNNSICAGTNVIFTATPTNGGTTPTYQWKNNNTNIIGATNATYSSTNLANGDVISVQMTSNATCLTTSSATSNSITMTVNQYSAPSVVASTASLSVCPGASVTFTSSTSNGGTAPQYQWMLNGNNINGATSSTYVASSGVNNGDVYSVSIVSNSSCATSSTAVSNDLTMSLVAPTASITASGSTAICGTGTVTLTASNGTSYLWSNGAITQSITVSTAGNYSVAVTTQGGCVSNSAATNVQKFPTSVKILPVGLVTVCEPNVVSFKTDPSIGAVSQFNFQWNLGGTPILGATDTVYAASGAGGGSITLTLSGGTCSRTSAPKTYTIKPLPVATFTAGGPTTICAGQSVTLTAPTITGYTYTWLNNGVSAGSGATKVFKVAGVYTVVAKFNGCTDTSNTSTTVVVNPLPIAGITALTPATFCAGDSCTMQATPSGATTYAWINGTTTVTTSTDTYATLVAGTFKMMVTDGNGCISKVTTTSVKTKVNPIPVASITASTSTTIAANGSVKLNASPSAGVTFQWFLNGSPISGATTKSYLATTGGSYTVAITKTGCTGTSAATIVTQTSAKEEAGLISNPTATENAVFELAAYPNPVSGVLTINVRGIEEVNATVQVMDFNGRVVAMKEMTTSSTTVDMTGYASGMYLIRYKDAEGRTGTIKINKQ